MADGDCDQYRMKDQRRRFLGPAGAEGARDRGGHAAAHCPAGHLLQQKSERKHHRPARECGRALLRGEPGVEELRRNLQRGDKARRSRKSQDAAQDGAGGIQARPIGRLTDRCRLTPRTR